MMYRTYAAFIASLSAVALMLAANETFAASGAAHRGGFTSTHATSRPSIAHSLRHHRRNNVGTSFWPGFWPGDFFDGSWNGGFDGYGGTPPDFTQPTSGAIPFANDVPWDWAHRYPPLVTPSDRPYVTSCPTETVTVPGGDGEEQTVNIMRCY